MCILPLKVPIHPQIGSCESEVSVAARVINRSVYLGYYILMESITTLRSDFFQKT